MKTKEAMEKDLKKFKLFPMISTVLLCIQMFWIVVGTCCILPVFTMEGLGDKSSVLFNCRAPVKFWVTFLTLCLQWGLGGIFTAWWVMEIRWPDRHDSDDEDFSIN